MVKNARSVFLPRLDMGYKGVAITDHNGCQAFPIAYGLISSYNKGKEEKDKFINQYRSIINSIKEKTDYKNHLELKHNNLKNPDKRRIINYLKKYYTFGIIINNSKVYKKIIFDKKSKGRYNEYCQRILIKNIIKNLLKKRIINKYDDIKLVINIDEQSTKTNGYYSLENGLYEELIHGIINYNYAKKQFEDTFGVKIIEMPNSLKTDELYNNPQLRLDDLMMAIKDPSIKAILTNIGGDDTVRLLRHMTDEHFEIIRNNPKIFFRFFLLFPRTPSFHHVLKGAPYRYALRFPIYGV